MMYWHHDTVGGWGWLMVSIGLLLFLALILLVFALVARAGWLARSGRTPAATAAPGPQRILAERYARGEIDDEEYRRRLATLSGNPAPPEGNPSPPEHG
jgi:putative membrane protein